MRTIVLAAVLAGALSGAASAQTLAQNWAWCRGDDLGQLISGCTAIIRSKAEAPEDLARAYFNRGRGLAADGQYDRAIGDLRNAIRLDPNYPEAFNSLGVCHAGKGEHAKAIADYDQALRLDPDYAIALYNRALSLQAVGRVPEADRDLRRAREVGPRLTPPKE